MFPSEPDRADRMCAEDPDAAAVRTALLKLERLAHATGWDGPDSPPRIFRLDLHAHGPERVDHAWCDDYTDMMRSFHEQRGYSMGQCLCELGVRAQALSALVVTGTVTAEWAAMPPEVVDLILRRRHQIPLAAGKDLEPPACRDSRCRFLGFGIRTEAWMVAYDDDDDDSADVSPAQDIRRQEVRLAHFMTRDSVFWSISRRRSDRPKISVSPLDANEMRGDIPRGLSLMVDAVVPEKVQIWPHSGIQPPFSGNVNPLTGR